MHRFPYRWTLAGGFPALGVEFHGRKVLSCFSGGGGSSMGYKLAGYDVVGGVEIDAGMADCYERNLKPKFLHRGDIRELAAMKDFPAELQCLDVLDGSPPCSTFSMVGNRERDWGVEKKFREGQKKQVLDTLFFDFIALADRLRPKMVIGENVMGMLLGRAQGYVARILESFRRIGYNAHWRVLRSESMGVPQARHRVFFFAVRDDLCNKLPMSHGLVHRHPSLALAFDEPVVPFREIESDSGEFPASGKLIPSLLPYIDYVKEGHSFASVHEKKSFFNYRRVSFRLPLPTIDGHSGRSLLHPNENRYLTKMELLLGSSWPLDYDFGLGVVSATCIGYVCGMSVPPVMMAQVASQVKEQWLDRIDG
jgi:DNA (cytosine-5)-methyltransferase 1